MAAFTKLSTESAFTPGPNIELQKDSDCCSCQEKWIGYRCSCYFISSESKTWNESRHLCASQKSSLLQLQSRDELQDFMTSSQQFYWIGLSYSEEQNAWLWESGSGLSRDLSLDLRKTSYNVMSSLVERTMWQRTENSMHSPQGTEVYFQQLCYMPSLHVWAPVLVKPSGDYSPQPTS
ncbi:natural killer cells antigen CD94 isoform X5 [Saimiri boliviensis]|uniref:natural killer cells antigen CD94 isoform X5 n=1 Tax=Saimiri boliviensis TaxID=27679 RepID=UPI003D774A65